MADNIVTITFPGNSIPLEPNQSTEALSNGQPSVTYSGSVTIDYSSVQSATNASTFYNISGQVFLNGTQLTDLSVQNFNGGNTYLFAAGTPGETGTTPFLGLFYDGEQPSTASAQATEPYHKRGGYYGSTQYDDPNPEPVTSISVCFASCTGIRTPAGDVAVERLSVGGLVITASGALRRIRWLGHRTVDCRRHPHPHVIMPVRITAHAFGANRPARDLVVSPGHSLCLDMFGEVLIPAGALVNGTTIVQQEVDQITYWHVELEGGHEIILAENMPAESYLDMGNRGFFAESGIVTFDASPDAPVPTHADFCRPFHAEGALVDVVRSQLRARAVAIGWTLDASDPFAGLHLVVNGVRVDPVTRGLQARFAVPAGAADVWLVSTTARPCEIAASDDRRELGVNVAGMTIDDGFNPPRALDLADPLLCVGFHGLEDAVRRWTAGRARLPTALWDGIEGGEDGFFLRVDLAGRALPCWAAPAALFEPVAAASPARLSLVASA